MTFRTILLLHQLTGVLGLFSVNGLGTTLGDTLGILGAFPALALITAVVAILYTLPLGPLFGRRQHIAKVWSHIGRSRYTKSGNSAVFIEN